MNVKIGNDAAQFPEKEYMNWIFVAVYFTYQSESIVKHQII